MSANISSLVASQIDGHRACTLLSLLESPRSIPLGKAGVPTRAEIAHALNVVLFQGILERVPSGMAYVADVSRAGGRINLDHGALRTVAWPHGGRLPQGEAAFTRFLRPLGYRLNGTYPLDKIGMTGRSYAHEDAPDEIAQFFVSEFHPERYSDAFQAAVTHVVSSSRDPLQPSTVALLCKLERDGVLPIAEAEQVIDNLTDCFGRQHATPRLTDYEVLLNESAEMAWIATEGNAFNHATDRVADVVALADQQKKLGRPMKELIEISANGTVLQTAFRAAPVVREFVCESGVRVQREVPGSFYEFITRLEIDDERGRTLDLSFDAGNAQGIFKMTAAIV